MRHPPRAGVPRPEPVEQIELPRRGDERVEGADPDRYDED
jgi:hypothetical protein